MKEAVPVTEADIAAAWERFHRYEIGGIPYQRDYDPTDHSDRHVREQLRAVLEADRKRVAERDV